MPDASGHLDDVASAVVVRRILREHLREHHHNPPLRHAVSAREKRGSAKRC